MSTYSDLNRRGAKSAPRVTDFQSVLNSIGNLMTTKPRQRLFRPDGFDLESLLFSLDDDTAFRIKNMLARAVAKDTRASLVYNETTVIPDVENHAFKVTARFRVKGLEDVMFTRVGTLKV